MARNLKITIDEDECVGDGVCCEEAPNTFEMNDDAKAVVKGGAHDDEETVIEAARNCPTDAIQVEDADTGEVIVPE
jgi:ferredoxin